MSIAWEHVLGHKKHFPVENLISEDEISHQTSVWVRNVEWLLDNDVRIGTQSVMKGVILQVSGVQVSSSVFIHSVVTNDLREIMHSKEIWIVPAWSYESCTHWGVWDLVVSLKHQWRCEVRLLLVGDLSFNRWSCATKVLIDQLCQLGGIDITSTWNNDVLSHVKLVVELLHLFSWDWVSVLSDTSARLTQIMISESCVMHHLQSVIEWIHTWSVLVNCWLQSLNLNWLKCRF